LRDKNPMWNGGTSGLKYPVDWTRTLRVSIRERDKYICKVCGEQQGERAHSVHHIDYDRDNCDPKNLITICVSCHQKTSFRRDYWQELFNDLIERIYG
jgi:5-methylcytosine-specific restriction endonuclease McrA